MPSPITRPLFTRFPALSQAIPIAPVATLPTPIHRLAGLESDLDIGGLYAKRDDLTGTVYGGNKVRKLEFLLGQAEARGAQFA